MKVMKKLCPLCFVLSLANVLQAQTNGPAPVSVPSTPASVAAPAVNSKPLAISGWAVIGDKTKAFGPKEEGGKIIFSGADFGKKGKSFAGYFEKTILLKRGYLVLNLMHNYYFEWWRLNLQTKEQTYILYPLIFFQ
jgi:hypothetical protein